MTRASRLTARATVLVLVGLALLSLVGLAALPPGVLRHGAPARAAESLAAPRPVADHEPHPARPVVWAEGQVLHLGRRSIDTHQNLLSLDVTDDGVAFTTLDGLVWFTDGTRPAQIGATVPARAGSGGIDWGPFGRPDRWVVSDNAGSRLAWLEVTELDRIEAVVYDTRRQRVVAQVPIGGSGAHDGLATILSVGDDRVYWTDGRPTGRDVGTHVFRYDVSTGRQWRVPVRDYLADVGTRPRMLLLGTSRRDAVVSDGVGLDVAFVGRDLWARGGEWWELWDAASGARLRLHAPEGSRYGYGVAERLELVEWLDDDRFVLLDTTGWNAGVHGGEDLLACRLSTGRCTVAVDRRHSPGSPVVPEYATPGGERATLRAVREAQE